MLQAIAALQFYCREYTLVTGLACRLPFCSEPTASLPGAVSSSRGCSIAEQQSWNGPDWPMLPA